MVALGFVVFDTAIGHCGIAWSDRGVVNVRLPDHSADQTRARLRARFPEATEATETAEAPGTAEAAGAGLPQHIREAVDEIVALLRGQRRDLAGIELDFDGVPEFHQQVYQVARAIPPGKTRTYGEVATLLGVPGSAQAVGQALGRNPFPIVVPCHRVLGAAGKMVGFSAPGGVNTKRRMLVIEGAVAEEPTLF